MDYSKIFTFFGQGTIYVAVTFLFIVIAKLLADRRTVNFDDDLEITEKGNMAVGFRRAGLYLGMAIAFAGTLSGPGNGFLTDLLVFIGDGIFITICMFICRHINDRVMLANIDNDEHAQNGNVAVGLVEAGMYIGTGFILNGAFSGPSTGFIAGIISAIVFFAIGQTALLVVGYIYELATPFNVREEIRSSNTSAAAALGSVMVALGLILRNSIAGPSIGWFNDIVAFGLYTAFSIILLLLFSKAVDIALLPKSNLAKEVSDDRNVSALALTGACYLAMAVIISAVL